MVMPWVHQPKALLQEYFVTSEADWLTPENLEWFPQRPLPSEKFSWPVLEPVTGRRAATLGTASVLLLPLVLAMALATVKVLTLGLAWFLAMASASMVEPVKAIALAKAMELVIAMALMRAARLSAPQPAGSQLVCWIVRWTQVSESDLQSIPAPTNRRFFLR